MLIRCKIDRGAGGTHVEFPEQGIYGGPAGNYHFAVNKKGDAVAEVEDGDHLAFFLGTAGQTYEVYESGGKKKAAPVQAELVPEVKPENPLDPLVPDKGN